MKGHNTNNSIGSNHKSKFGHKSNQKKGDSRFSNQNYRNDKECRKLNDRSQKQNWNNKDCSSPIKSKVNGNINITYNISNKVNIVKNNDVSKEISTVVISNIHITTKNNDAILNKNNVTSLNSIKIENKNFAFRINPEKIATPIMNDIKFGDNYPNLETYKNKFWNINTCLNVEFFAGEMTNVRLINYNDPNLVELLNSYVNDNPIALDLEWRYDQCGTNNPIALFQFCSSKGALLIRMPEYLPKAEDIQNLKFFLEANKFIMKGTYCDRIKLLTMFGEDLKIDYEDVEITRLRAHGHSPSFNSMIEDFAGTPVVEFKDKDVSMSNWNAPVLTAQQVLYAAFDVVGLFKCISNFDEPDFDFKFTYPNYNPSYPVFHNNNNKNINNSWYNANYNNSYCSNYYSNYSSFYGNNYYQSTDCHYQNIQNNSTNIYPNFYSYFNTRKNT
ncbi:hypothetical protein TRFO_33396 [Tritrichomonas foetus]|uniref:3'-5' exonuclease domain-containing protein n=1 Tax=Tritrichomonas foetus TaxID=1144522 RepID=A0A1J4JNK3_9EUKA|nr:hypothetical protein TRFO_33396 [Tritrichomonas foetus]|eukprot:OHT00016.1 hypothetical protein TRFO_33396 [Tritrichomonas foetus]